MNASFEAAAFIIDVTEYLNIIKINLVYMHIVRTVY